MDGLIKVINIITTVIWSFYLIGSAALGSPILLMPTIIFVIWFAVQIIFNNLGHKEREDKEDDRKRIPKDH